MRLRISITTLCSITVALCLLPSVHASDVLSRLTHGDQYSLALGTVLSASDAAIEFEVETIIAGEPLTVVISAQIPGAFIETALLDMKLEPGEYIVLSLDKESALYTIAWGCFKVSSLDAATLEVVQGPLAPGDLAAFQWYINSGGTENDFYFIESSAYVRHPDGTETQIYPPTDSASHPDPVQAPVQVPAQVPGGNVESSSPQSESLDSDGTASATTVTPRDEGTFVYVGIALGLVLSAGFVYSLIKTRR